MPPLARQLTTSRPPPLLQVPSIPGSASDWRSNVTIEDRLSQRQKIHDAYARHCSNYSQLLDCVVAVEEELVFAAAVGRLEYFRSGIDWEGKLRMKRGQLGLNRGGEDEGEDTGDGGSGGSGGGKRGREDKGEEEPSGSGGKDGSMEVSDEKATGDDGEEGVKKGKKQKK